MSAAPAGLATSAATSITALVRAIMRWSLRERWLACHVEEPADKALAVAHGRHVAAQPGVKAETAARGVDGKQEHQQGEEHVSPRPFGGIAVEAEPELQRIGDSQHADKAHRETEDHRSRKHQLGEEDDRPEDGHVRQYDVLEERTVKFEGGIG